jgi:homocysteine S-methyltransferase
VNDPVGALLAHQDVMILDGGLGTELERQAVDLRDPLWSARVLLDAPERIRDLHLSFFRAGADVAISASYQATFQGLGARGLSRQQAAAVISRSVTLAREARDAFWAEVAGGGQRQPPLVAASVGPYGAFRADGSEYRGAYGLTVEELMAFHRPRLEVLVQAGAELLACETIPCPEEAEALVRCLEDLPQTPAWMSFSCADGRHVCQGEPFADCVALAAASPQVVAVGLNCSPMDSAASLLRSAAGITAKPLLAYPNSNEVWDAGLHIETQGAVVNLLTCCGVIHRQTQSTPSGYAFSTSYHGGSKPLTYRQLAETTMDIQRLGR